jgi:hypothetical protein
VKKPFTGGVKGALDIYIERAERHRRWDELLKFARQHPAPRWVFRGQSQKWPLKPTVGRTERYSRIRELQLFNEFKRLANPMIDRTQVASDWDWLFLAQHHGLPTRLLDWTTNPLIAAYFACETSARGKRDGEIIAVEIADVGRFSEDDLVASPFDVPQTRFMFPTVVAPRMASQRGLFSIHSVPDRNWILKEKTTRHVIRAGDKAEFRELLFGLGVDSAMAMADLDGTAANLAWRFKTGRAF